MDVIEFLNENPLFDLFDLESFEIGDYGPDLLEKWNESIKQDALSELN